MKPTKFCSGGVHPRLTGGDDAGGNKSTSITHRLTTQKTDNPPTVQQYHFLPGYERCNWQLACNLRLAAKMVVKTSLPNSSSVVVLPSQLGRAALYFPNKLDDAFRFRSA
jgi:hypothetical protein